MPDHEKPFVSINQEMQFYCKQYWILLGIKDLYSIYKRRVWKIQKSYELTPEQIQTHIDTFKWGIKDLEEWWDKFAALKHLFDITNQ